MAETEFQRQWHIQTGVWLRGGEADCSLLVSVTGSQTLMDKKEVNALSPTSEMYGKLRGFESREKWFLKPGRHSVEIEGLQASEAASKRGATLTLESEIAQPTEYYLRKVFSGYAAKILLIGGVLGLIICEAVGAAKER